MIDNTLDILLSYRKEPIELTNNELKKKFRFIGKTHTLVKTPLRLVPGDIINHISYTSNKLSPPGIIHNIEYYYDNNNKRSIKKIKLVNTYLGIFWEINMMNKKYYLFESMNNEPSLFDADALLNRYGDESQDQSNSSQSEHSDEKYHGDDTKYFWQEQFELYDKNNKK